MTHKIDPGSEEYKRIQYLESEYWCFGSPNSECKLCPVFQECMKYWEVRR